MESRGAPPSSEPARKTPSRPVPSDSRSSPSSSPNASPSAPVATSTASWPARSSSRARTTPRAGTRRRSAAAGSRVSATNSAGGSSPHSRPPTRSAPLEERHRVAVRHQLQRRAQPAQPGRRRRPPAHPSLAIAVPGRGGRRGVLDRRPLQLPQRDGRVEVLAHARVQAGLFADAADDGREQHPVPVRGVGAVEVAPLQLGDQGDDVEVRRAGAPARRPVAVVAVLDVLVHVGGEDPPAGGGAQQLVDLPRIVLAHRPQPRASKVPPPVPGGGTCPRSHQVDSAASRPSRRPCQPAAAGPLASTGCAAMSSSSSNKSEPR